MESIVAAGLRAEIECSLLDAYRALARVEWAFFLLLDDIDNMVPELMEQARDEFVLRRQHELLANDNSPAPGDGA
jgi:hypothetical protein